jgi:hypothetical protein
VLRRSEPASQVPRADDARIVYSARVLSGALPLAAGSGLATMTL